jgi:TusA-related sulfurtransferase
MTAPTADHTLDCKGMLCPMPIIKLSKAIKEIAVGQVLLLEATDPGSKPDVAAWQRRTRNEVVHQTEEGDVFRFWIRRRV